MVRDARDVQTRVAATRRTKPPTEVQELAAVSHDGDTLARPRAGASAFAGHSYSDVVITAQARVHLGDSIKNVVNNFYGAGAARKGGLGNDDTALVQAILELLAAVMHTAQCICTLSGRTMTAVSILLPSSHLAYFEDALGRRRQIDVQFIGDWTSFHFILVRTFRNELYAQDVTDFKYRLFGRSGGKDFVDPQMPPPYASVFKAGRHVQMSFHSEVDAMHGRLLQERPAEATAFYSDWNTENIILVRRRKVFARFSTDRLPTSPWLRRTYLDLFKLRQKCSIQDQHTCC